MNGEVGGVRDGGGAEGEGGRWGIKQTKKRKVTFGKVPCSRYFS